MNNPIISELPQIHHFNWLHCPLITRSPIPVFIEPPDNPVLNERIIKNAKNTSNRLTEGHPHTSYYLTLPLQPDLPLQYSFL